MEKKITIRVREDVFKRLEDLCILEHATPTAVTNFLIEWSTEVLRRGEALALKKLTEKERDAILAATNGWLIAAQPLPDGKILAHEIEDFFALGEGAMWDWSKEEVDTLIQKVRNMSPDEALGLILWGRKYWHHKID